MPRSLSVRDATGDCGMITSRVLPKLLTEGDTPDGLIMATAALD